MANDDHDNAADDKEMLARHGGKNPGTPPVTFQVTTHWKRRRGEPGVTRIDSRRLLLSEALDWILGELSDEAVTISHDTATDITDVRIIWSLVPPEIRYGKTPDRRN